MAEYRILERATRLTLYSTFDGPSLVSVHKRPSFQWEATWSLVLGLAFGRVEGFLQAGSGAARLAGHGDGPAVEGRAASQELAMIRRALDE
jgi:hypothetical protein